MRRIRGALLALALITAAGCGDGEDTTGPTLDRQLVAGTYILARLDFDPQGSLPREDLLLRMTAAEEPRLVLSRTTANFQLVYQDPESGFISTVEGTYATTEDGVVLTFASDADAQLVFLPRRAGLEYDPDTGSLSFVSQVTVTLARLRALVPSYGEEQLPSNVVGLVEVSFEKPTVTGQG